MYLFRDKKEYILNTKLNTNECSRRLKSLIDEERFSLFSLSGYAGSKEIIGKINGYKFRLQKRSILSKHSPTSFFYGQFNKQNDGTVIKGYFGTPTFIKVMTIFAFGGSFILMIIGIFFANEDIIARSNTYTEYANLFIFPICVLLFFILLIKISHWLSRHSKEYIVEFLRESMEVEIVDR